ncbi:hypothetical protein MNV49_000385 [Pseudohyphozyma bogoriensis]|nr:hypothetical protein MNV49_000385 [Pseudohyphozyma bogoriensis]
MAQTTLHHRILYRGKPTPRVLHSAHALDPLLLDLISLICREYILTWYSKISRDPDRAFINQVTSIFIHLVQAVEVRLAQVDLCELAVLDLPAVLERHVRDFEEAEERHATGHAHNLDRDNVFHLLQPHIAISLVPKGSALVPQVDKAYLRALVTNLLALLLPPEDYRAETERAIVREIVVNIVLGNVFDKVAQPWFLHTLIAKLLDRPNTSSIPPPTRKDSTPSSPTPFLPRAVQVLQSLPTFFYAVLASLSALYHTARSSPVPLNLQPYSLTAPTLSLLVALLPSSPLLSQSLHYLSIPLSLASSFTSSLVFWVCTKKIFTANLTKKILEAATNGLFPGGHPPPRVPDPTPEEQELVRKLAEERLSFLLPSLLARVTLPPSIPNRQLALSQHILKPLSSHVANVHLFLLLVDLFVGKLFPELLVGVDPRPGLNGWHPGEAKLQRALGFFEDVRDNYENIRTYLPQQHRIFHTHNITFLPLVLRDERGRVWASFLCGEQGTPGFIDSPDEHTLDVRARSWQGDPAMRLLKGGTEEEDRFLVAGVGVETTTRRRNKLAGHVAGVSWEGVDLNLEITIDEAMGNCPKYIQIRKLLPSRSTPTIAAENLSLSPTDVLPQFLIDFIHNRDTLYLATAYDAPANVSDKFPSHLGMNHRGGKPGFVRVRGDKKTLVLPDYSGNRLMSSLGNIEVTLLLLCIAQNPPLIPPAQISPIAGVVFPDYRTGDILYLTCQAETHIGPIATSIMPRTKVLTLLTVTGYTFVRNALPFREDQSTYEASPYSPPVRYLTEERQATSTLDASAVLVSAELLSAGNGGEVDLARFTFRASEPMPHKPGQYVVLQAFDPDKVGYLHMARTGFEKLVNDDGIRTWTISSAAAGKYPTEFSITVRKLGQATQRLFHLAEYYTAETGHLKRQIEFPLLGVGGSFVLPDRPTKMTWIAGGIGVTPFLSFLEAFAKGTVGEGEAEWEAELFVTTREPDVLVSLVATALDATSKARPRTPLRLSLRTFSHHSSPFTESPRPELFSLSTHIGRMTRGAFDGVGREALEKVYLCGPPAFEEGVMAGLVEAGISETAVTRESFDY